MRFRPLKALEGGDTYEATIEGVESLSGIPMAEPYRWSFTTNHAAITAAVVTEKTSYYYHNDQWVAMRRTGVGGEDAVYWLVSDHLRGPAWCSTREGTNEVAESRHLPYGGRWTKGEIPTDGLSIRRAET